MSPAHISIRKPFYFRKRKKSIVIDPDTGERIELKEPSGGHKGRECNGGCRVSGLPRTHGSVEEAFYCNKLHVLKRTGAIKDYQSQVEYHLRDVYGKSVGSHYVDFVVETNDGKLEAREYKGLEFGVWKLKAALFTWNYPDIPYRVMRYQDLT